MTGLTEETLTRLNADVSVPRYDRRDVTTGIVHLGVGNFHRSHQAMYIDTLMNSGAAMDWGICGIGLQPSNVAHARRAGGPGRPLHPGHPAR